METLSLQFQWKNKYPKCDCDIQDKYTNKTVHTTNDSQTPL